MNGEPISGDEATNPMLSQRELELWTAFKAEASARHREELFSLYLPFAKQMARRHFMDRSGGDIEMSDLSQLACAGLLEAIDRYDPTIGAPFRSFAARRMSGSILDGIAKLSEVRQQISFRSRVRSERARSLRDSRSEILQAHDAMQALTDLTVGLAIGFMLDGSGLYVGEDQPDVRANAYENLAWKDIANRVGAEVSQLRDSERTVVTQHYTNGLTFDQIASLLGVTKGRVSQLHKAAITRLRHRLPRAAFRLER